MAMNANATEYLSRDEAAEYLGGLRPQTLASWAVSGRHDLPFVKIGKLVRYRRDDLDSWLAARRGTSNAMIRESSLAIA